MSIRTILIPVLCFLFLLSCRENKSADDQDSLNTEENEFSPVDRNIPREAVDDEDLENPEMTSRENNNNSTVEDPPQSDTPRRTTTVITGQYIKIGQESDAACACYCLDLSSTTAELCLVNGKMYVNTRLQKNPDNTINVFLSEPSARNTEGKEMPWKDFDRNSAIATVKPKSNGELEFDWLGFTINGDLAIDYAILGKKTLEGDYKKK
jgi:zinc D-Ala-D-Ala carboxypeptidase